MVAYQLEESSSMRWNTGSGLNVQQKKYIMQDNIEPRNEQGQAHGYWDVKWRDGGWYKGTFAYHEPFGYFIITWTEYSKTEYYYYAR
jgi:hypothetical protein